MDYLIDLSSFSFVFGQIRLLLFKLDRWSWSTKAVMPIWNAEQLEIL